MAEEKARKRAKTRRNREFDREEVVVDWKTGEFTERQLAAKHSISPSTVHTIVAGISKDLAPIISAKVAINQKIANLPEREVSKIDQIVSKKTEHILFFTNAAIKNVQESMELECSDQNDFKLRADTILKGKETVIGKEPAAAIQVNVGNAFQMSKEELTALASGGR